MPIFVHLDGEKKVQINDKTRLDASKTYSTNNETEFDKITIRPSLDEVDYDVYAEKASSRYLDWEFQDFKIDIDSTNNKIDFSEDAGATTLSATITGGTYTPAALATEVKTGLEASGALTYTVSFDEEDKLTISSTARFDLVLDGPNRNSLLTKQLYFDESELSSKTSYTSGRVESLQRQIRLTAGEDRYQVQTITCAANTSNALNNDYFFIWSGEDAVKYYAWFNSSAGGNDPSISGATGIEVAVTNGDTAAQVATALASALDAHADFSASALGTVVTVTNSDIGWATPAQEGLGTGFTFAVTTEGQTQVEENFYVSVYSELGDSLFSSDADLQMEEQDIRRWVPPGKNSFKYVHRRAQEKILEYLDREGYVDIFGHKYTKWAIKDHSEVKEWAMYMVLRMIFEGISNATDDVFRQKRTVYESDEIAARQRAILRLDTDGDGVVTEDEGLDPHTVRLVFR